MVNLNKELGNEGHMQKNWPSHNMCVCVVECVCICETSRLAVESVPKVKSMKSKSSVG